jgi:hypothetical protein
MLAQSARLVGRHFFWGATPRPPRGWGLGFAVGPQRSVRGSRSLAIRRRLFVKKILALAAVAGAVLLIVRRSRSAKAEADLWREATAEK